MQTQIADGANQAPPQPPFDAEKRIAQLIALKDKIKEIEARQKEELRIFKETQAKLEALILEHLQKVNCDNFSTPVGTAHKLTRKSASLEDPGAFMDYVVKNAAFDLLDRKANVSAVEAFIGEHNSAPPGVKFSQMLTLGVRRK